MGTLLEDLETGANWISTALTEDGYEADFTPESLSRVDRFFDDHSAGGRPKPGGRLADRTGTKLFALGAYIGEVLRRNRGGYWITDDKDPEGELNFALRLRDGTVCWPGQRAMKRLANGAEDGIAVYGMGLGLNVGPVFSEPTRPWWRFW